VLIAAWDKTKYSCTGNYKLAQALALKNTVPYSSKLTAGATKCISAALSRNTWSKYNSAWNAFKKFENLCRKILSGLCKNKHTLALQHGA
jgi:hypothetical protein